MIPGAYDDHRFREDLDDEGPRSRGSQRIQPADQWPDPHDTLERRRRAVDEEADRFSGRYMLNSLHEDIQGTNTPHIPKLLDFSLRIPCHIQIHVLAIHILNQIL